MGAVHQDLMNRMTRTDNCCEDCGFEYDKPEVRELLEHEIEEIEYMEDGILIEGQTQCCPNCGSSTYKTYKILKNGTNQEQENEGR